MTTMPLIICGVVLCLSQLCLSAQSENTARQGIIEFSKGRKPIVEIHDVQKLNGADRIPADDLKLVLRSHGDVLLKGGDSKDKFYALSAFCEMIVSSPDGKKLSPDLITAVYELEAPSAEISEIKDWDKLAMHSRGGRIGLLFNCILDLAGKDGFEEMFNHFEKEGRVAENTILLQLLAGRRDGGKYLDLLLKKVSEKQSLKLEAVIHTSINRIREGTIREVQ